MINRTAGSGARGWALPVAGLALLLVALLLPAIPVRAASSIQIEARGLLGGRYAVGGWMGIAVTLVNDGEPTQGTLAATTESGSVQRFVEMPAGARKEVTLYLQPEAFQRQVTIQFQEPNGTVKAIVETRVLEQASSQFAIVGDGPGTLRPQLSTGDGIGVPAPLSLTLADLPERSEPLEGLSAIVWADDSSGLTEAQRRSIERWVANGGQLVIVGGADWQARTAGFAEMLPVDGLTAVDDVEQVALASWAGAEGTAVESATVSTGTLRDGARGLIRTDDGTLLASMRTVVRAGSSSSAPTSQPMPTGAGKAPHGSGRECCLPTGRSSSSSAASRRGDPERDGDGAQQSPFSRGPTGRAAARRHRGVHPPHRSHQLRRPAADGSTGAGVGDRPLARGRLHRLLVRDRQLDEGQRGDRQPDLADSVRWHRRRGDDRELRGHLLPRSSDL